MWSFEPMSREVLNPCLSRHARLCLIKYLSSNHVCMRKETTAVLTYMQASTVKEVGCEIYEKLVSSICDWGISPGSVQFINSRDQSGDIRTTEKNDSNVFISFGWSGTFLRWLDVKVPEPSPYNSSLSDVSRSCNPRYISCQTIPVPTTPILSVPTAGKIKHPFGTFMNNS